MGDQVNANHDRDYFFESRSILTVDQFVRGVSHVDGRYRLIFFEYRSYRPWERSHTDRGTNHVRTKDSGTDHVLVNLWLTLYKLTGWLASLHLAVEVQ